MPKIIGYGPSDPWERKVLQAFKEQLPHDWVVMPNVRWSVESKGYVRDGEADFVILIPELGLVVVEVKGSREFKVDEDGIWYRRERDVWKQLQESPLTQATKNMHQIVQRLCDNLQLQKGEFPGGFSYLVVYPQGEASALPPMFDESTLATHKHMGQLASRLRHSLGRRGSEAAGRGFTGAIVDRAVDVLSNRKFVVVKADNPDDVANDANRIEKLTQQQHATLSGLFSLPRIAVVGPAGSGKTVLALWRLAALVDDGANPLYVCFNKALAESLQLANPDLANHISSVDKLFMELCKGVQRPTSSGELNKFFRERLPEYVIDRVQSMVPEEKYDAILIDEAQDFSESQLIALTELLRGDNSSWALFADWRQDLYEAGKGKPINVDVVFHLHHNCRNAVRINDATNSFLSEHIPSMPGMPDGCAPTIEASSDQAGRAWELAKQWSGRGAVAILSPFSIENSAMNARHKGYGLSLSMKISDLGCEGVVYFSTIKSFKGMEADAVIVVDVMEPEKHKAFSEEDLYVACTRAKTRLALITQNKDVAQQLSDVSLLRRHLSQPAAYPEL